MKNGTLRGQWSKTLCWIGIFCIAVSGAGFYPEKLYVKGYALKVKCWNIFEILRNVFGKHGNIFFGKNEFLKIKKVWYQTINVPEKTLDIAVSVVDSIKGPENILWGILSSVLCYLQFFKGTLLWCSLLRFVRDVWTVSLLYIFVPDSVSNDNIFPPILVKLSSE